MPQTKALTRRFSSPDANASKQIINIATSFPFCLSALASSSKDTMKMIRAMKRLKFWARKRRKKKHSYEPYTYYHPAAPAPTCYQYYCCPIGSSPQPQPQPSAPPLPPWLDYNQPDDLAYASATESEYSSREIFVETCSVLSTPALPSDGGSSCSYQQYMVSNPVYGLPVVKATGREKIAGIFGCVFEFGANLIRCFCPCFRIREV